MQSRSCPDTELERGFDGANKSGRRAVGRPQRKARDHSRRRQQPIHRLGNRPRRPRRRRGTGVHLPGRSAGEARPPARAGTRRARCSAIATSPTGRRSTRCSREARKTWGSLDFVVHCIAFSDKDQLTGRYIETTEDNFTKSLAISCYSFTAIAQRAEKLMPNGGAMLTLTYYGAEKWMPHYNVMGVAKAALEASVRYLAADLGEKAIRVNAISAGPIKTLAASGIGDFRYILQVERVQRALAPHRDHRRGRRHRGLPAVADVARRDRRDSARRRRLSRRRHEEPGRAGYFGGEGGVGFPHRSLTRTRYFRPGAPRIDERNPIRRGTFRSRSS